MNEAEALSNMKFPKDRRVARIHMGKKHDHIWRDGVLQIMVTRACNEACFGCTQGSNLAGKPVMMTVEQYEQACISLRDYFGVVGLFGGNPSLIFGTRVYTDKGIFPIQELENKTFNVRNLDNQISPAFCRLSGTNVPIYELTLKGGHTVYATAEHEWPVTELLYPKSHNKPITLSPIKKYKTTELRIGMRLPILRNKSLGYGFDGNREDGFLAGWLMGNGWIGQREEAQEYATYKVRHIGMMCNEFQYESGIASKFSSKLRELGSDVNWQAIKKCHELQTASISIDDWMSRFGIISKKYGLPTAVWSTASEEFRVGFLDGLFSSDGTIDTTKAKGYAVISITTAFHKMAKDICDLLGFYGIKTSIQKCKRVGKFPNGKDYGKLYTCFDITINGSADVEHFKSIVKLTNKEKQAKLDSVLVKRKDIRSESIEIESIKLTDRRESVWDISVGDKTHCFQIANCVTGNCMHPKFEEMCAILRKHIPYEQRGLWSNNLMGKGDTCRATFNPAVSNLNVHLDTASYNEMCQTWPEARKYVKGDKVDSRHSPVFTAMKDLIPDENKRWDLIADCDVNQDWSAIICIFRGEPRGYFCEIAGAQAMLHEKDPNYPDLGLKIEPGWWKSDVQAFAPQVRHHCHDCGFPLKGYGELAVNGKREQVTITHRDIYIPKIKGREVELVTSLDQIKQNALERGTKYIENSGV